MQDLYRFEIDTHCHSVGSVHAFSTVTEIAETAHKKDLKAVAVTDHHGSLGHIGDDYTIMAPDDSYFHVFCNRLYMDEPVRILKGIELNIIDQAPWVIQPRKDLEPLFEIKLAGIHTLNHLYKKSDDKIKNTDNILQAMCSGERPFHVFVHPCQKITPVHIDAIAKECAARNIALELNNSSLCYDRDDMQTVKEMIRAVIQYNGFMVCGTDAHVPNEIADFSSCIQILKEFQVPEKYILNLKIENVLSFLKR